MPQQGNLFIERLYQQIEMDMLTNIGRLIGNGEGVTKDNVIQWQVEKLGNLGLLHDEQIKVLAEYAGMTVGQMKAYVNELGLAELKDFDKSFKKYNDAGVPYKEITNTVYSRLLGLESQAVDVMNMVNSSMLESSDLIYKDVITKSAAEVITGNSTLDKALVKTIRDWASRGIPVIRDVNGRLWGTEGYVSMVLRSTQKNVAVAMQEERMDDYDVDLVEISSHADSRTSHIDYQGKIFSRSGKSKKYPPLSQTSYGAIDGIVTGIHCRHQMYAYFEGISVKRYEPYDKKETVEKYEQSQRQRYLERQIRRAKKEASTLEAMNASDDEIQRAKSLIRSRQANMRGFINESGRTRRYNRERVV